MTAMPVMPREARDWTVDDLELLPDDGLQYELLDGVLLVSPAPVPIHQRAIVKLLVLLQAACPDDLEVLVSPLDWQPDRRTSLQPDVLVLRPENIGAKNVTGAMPLAVEVLSPSTRRKDLVFKRSKYEDEAVGAYWIVDPYEPSVQAYELRDGRYVDAGTAKGADTLALRLPFPVSVTPADLITR